MNAEAEKIIREKWLPALRSGEFDQGVGVLKDLVLGDPKPKYCCLGVLCEVAGLPTWGPMEGRTQFQFAAHGCEDLGDWERSMALLPYEWAEELDIKPDGGFFPAYQEESEAGTLLTYAALTELNDSLGWSFAQIADFIEHQILNPETGYRFKRYAE